MAKYEEDFWPEGMGMAEPADDDLDFLSGGIPLEGRDPAVDSTKPRTMQAAAVRPADDAKLWF